MINLMSQDPDQFSMQPAINTGCYTGVRLLVVAHFQCSESGLSIPDTYLDGARAQAGTGSKLIN